jgi:hypothetical protein
MLDGSPLTLILALMFEVSLWLAFGSRKGHFGLYIHAILSVQQLMFEVSLWLVFGNRKGHFGFYLKCPDVNVWGVPSVGVRESRGTLWFDIHAILSVLQLMFKVSIWLVFGSRKGHFGFYLKCPGVNVWGVPVVGVRESKGTLCFYMHAILSVLQLMFEVSLWLVLGSRKGHFGFYLKCPGVNVWGVPFVGVREGHFGFIFMLS